MNVERKEEPEIVIIGASILDVLAYPADEEVFRTGSSPAEDIRLSVGGDALNEATVLARLGMKVLLETVIGSGKAGKFILDHCRDCGILLPADCVREDFSTGINVVFVSRDGSRHFLTNPHGSLRRLTLQDIHMPFPQSAKIVCFASIFVFPEIGPKELEVIFRTAENRENRMRGYDETKEKRDGRGTCGALSYVDYLIPNDEEAMLLAGENTVEEAAESLREPELKQ